MQCTDCMYLYGRSHAPMATHLAPFTVKEKDLKGEEIPKVRYAPVCEEHMIELYQRQRSEVHYPYVRLSDGVFRTWPTYCKERGIALEVSE